MKTDLKRRADTRSRAPKSDNFAKYMTTSWADSAPVEPVFIPEKSFTEVRREKLSKMFLGDRLIIEAGDLKTRSNDVDYRFRPNSAFAYFTGLGVDLEPGAVLVFNPIVIKQKGIPPHNTHTCTLYIDSMKDRSSTEFYESSTHGEFWIGKRLSLEQFEQLTGITTKDKTALKSDLKNKIFWPHKVRVISDSKNDDRLLETASEMRLVKDKYEIEQMRKAIIATKTGFERVIRNLTRAKNSARGERIVEGEFYANALESGNSVGYETIAAAGEHATTLHWIQNTGAVRENELLLLDAGVEVDSLYTADITRTMPISGEFNKWQRDIYDLVLLAADEAFKVATPGKKFRDVHDRAMEVIAEGLSRLGILGVDPKVALREDQQQHRRWMCHGTSHHLGIDVHDCAHAREQNYRDAELKPGMIFTIEPGLYFKNDDLLVPAQYRGIGVRIEDDILITDDGAENLSVSIPRSPEHLTSWMKQLMNEEGNA